MNILVHWNDDFELNIKEIDQQHRKFIDMINILYDSIIRKEDNETLAKTIADMRDYAFVHFKTEEKLFAQVGYEETEAHQEEHHFFLENIEKFYVEYQMYDTTLAVEVLTFLQEWLINHIMHSDRKYLTSFMIHGIK
jgi:hemerythrin